MRKEAMGGYSTLEDRVEIATLAEAGKSDQEIAKQTGWSERMVRKWRLRAQREGRCGLEMEFGRPKRGALSSYRVEIRDQLLKWRRAHPGWGPKTLHAELKRAFNGTGEELPSPASIGMHLAHCLVQVDNHCITSSTISIVFIKPQPQRKIAAYQGLIRMHRVKH